MIPLLALGVVIGFVGVAIGHWNEWTGGAAVQVTNDAYVRADVTRLATRIAGEVSTVAVRDFQHVKAGDLLVQIDPADYEAAVAEAEAHVSSAQAALDNLANQISLQRAAIASVEAARQAATARELEARQERDRQQLLVARQVSSHRTLEQATAAYAAAQSSTNVNEASIEQAKRQLDVLIGTRRQRQGELAAAKAALALAKLRLGYTRIEAPFDGVVSERQVQPNDYVNVGSNLISIVPLPNVYVIANYRETQLTRVAPGQPVEITVDTFPGEVLYGHVARLSPASGSQFTLLPPDNATGNFTKVVQRIPVRIEFDEGQALLDRLRPGMSVETRIITDAKADKGQRR